MTQQFDSIRAIFWREDGLYLLDQRKLPQSIVELHYNNAGDVALAIKNMVVRGAPAIGISAAYAVVLSAQTHVLLEPKQCVEKIERDIEILAASRPTAVNLFWALERMQLLLKNDYQTNTTLVAALLTEADAIHNEDLNANYEMGRHGAALLQNTNTAVLTHCNAGALATGGYGTALGVIRSAFNDNKISAVYADETRPWMQGARLTAWEMVQEKIPVTLLCEGAAASLMATGKIAWVIVGSDRIAANGDVANKIGTYSLAILARHHGVKFMVVAPTSTVDMKTQSGADIPIEQRDAEEVFACGGDRIATTGAEAWNPAFDVTPADLVDYIVTERGVVEKPTLEKMQKLMQF